MVKNSNSIVTMVTTKMNNMGPTKETDKIKLATVQDNNNVTWY